MGRGCIMVLSHWGGHLAMGFGRGHAYSGWALSGYIVSTMQQVPVMVDRGNQNWDAAVSTNGLLGGQPAATFNGVPGVVQPCSRHAGASMPSRNL